ncbi:hypothetical protein [Hymenobacter qilianensis]|uniref:Uncharacterized protein n=1 Tax=Hymenobacter qilianensis TaxID=1385715 RepID=A0A7H0GTW6_9BACT|nr:hypothetical protein [Hymenobacter qilianensis]QNP51732.1 hypothetical protein H9L05_17470 [Hymenobacter qilianensis]
MNGKELTRVEGSSVSFDIRSFIAIPCAGYEKQFPSARPFSIIDKEKLTAIDKYLRSLQPHTQNNEVDIRAKAILFYNNQTSDTLCIGKFNSYYKGEAVQVDKELISLLGINP